MDLTVVVGHGATTGTDFDKAPECGWGEVIFDIHRANKCAFVDNKFAQKCSFTFEMIIYILFQK